MSLMGFLHHDKALLLTGAIFKSTVPDESDEERREIERCASFFFQVVWLPSFLLTPFVVLCQRMVAEAAAGKSKHQQMQAEAKAAAKLKREEMLRAGAAKKEADAGT